MELDEITYDKVDGVGEITLNRPDQLNPISARVGGTRDQIAWAVGDAEDDPVGTTLTTNGGGINLNSATQLNGATSLITAGGTIDANSIQGTGETLTVSVGSATNLNLTNANNNFGTVDVTSADNVQLSSDNNIDLGASTISGTLNVTAANAITNSGALLVSGLTTLASTNDDDITLTNSGNSFSSVAVTSAGDVSLQDIGAINLGPISLNGNLNVTANGAITQSGGAIVLNTAGMTATYTAGSGNDITLNNAGNTEGTVAIVSGNNVILQDSTDLVLSTANISGNFNLTLNGNLTQNGALTLSNPSGTATFAVGSANNLSLTNSSNSFYNMVISSANNATIINSQNTSFGASTVNGNLSLTTTGTIAQTAPISVGGNASFNAGAAAISLTQNNTFSGSVALINSGDNNVAVTDMGLLDLAASTVGSGALTLTGAGVTQTGAIIQAGNATSVDIDAISNATAGPITLTNSGNSFTSPVTLTTSGNNNVALVNSGALTLAGVTVGSGTLSLTSGGDLTQTGAITQAAAAGAVTLSVTAPTSNIYLASAANDFSGVISFGGTLANIQDVSLRNIDVNAALPTNLASLTNLRNLTLIFNNAGISFPALTLNNGGSLSATAGGAITQTGALTVPGTSSFTASGGAILLTQSNSLTDAVSLNNSGNYNVAVVDSLALDIGTSSVGSSTLNLSGAGISQSGPITQAASAGAVTVTAGDGVIDLSNSGNDFTGSVSLNNSGDNNVSITNGAALALGTSNVGTGTLGITAGGSITETGAITQAASAGDITIAVTAANSDILLDTQPNDFSAPDLNFSGTLSNIRDLAIRNIDANAGTTDTNFNLLTNLRNLTIIFDNSTLYGISVTLHNSGDLYVDTSGDLSGGTGGNVIQISGPIVVPGTSTFILGDNALIDDCNCSNSYMGAVSISNSGDNSVTLINSVPLIMGTSSFGTGAISLTGAGISQTGAITQAAGGGLLTLSAGANAITLTNSGNNFTGSVSLNNSGANDVQLTTSGTLALATSSVGSGALDLTTGGSISETGPFTQAANAGIVSFSLTSPNSDIILSTQPNVFTGYFDVVGTLTNLRDFGIWNTSASEGSTVIDLLSLTNLRNLTIIYDNVGEVTLPTLTLNNSGNLIVDTSGDSYGSGGEISQSGVLTIPGTASFNAGANPISLTLDNNISGAITLMNSGANDVALTNSGLLALASVTVGSGNLTLTGLGITQSGAITQASGALSATFNSGAGAITLTNSGNSFTSPVSLNNSGDNDISLSNSGALSIAASSVGSGALNLTADGNFSETGAIVQAAAAGTVTLTENAATSNIILNQANDINGAVTFATGATLGNVQDFSLSNIDASAAAPTNLTSLTALRNLTFNFSNASANIALPALTLYNGGNLSITAGSAINQTGAITVPGATTLNAGTTIDFTTNGSANSLSGNVALTSGTSATITDTLTLNFATSSIGTNLSAFATASGAGIGQVGTMAVGGTTSFSAGANAISLTQDNNFSGAVTLSNSGDNNIALTNSGALTLAASNIGSGSLSIISGGMLSETGAIIQAAGAGTVSLAETVSPSTIDLNQANDFTGPITFSGNLSLINNVTLRNVDANASLPTNLASLSNLTNLSIIFNNTGVSLPTLTLNNGGDLSVNTGGAITQTGALIIPGTASFTAGDNAITLTQSNSFTGDVSLSNSGDNNVAVNNSIDLSMGASSVGTGTLNLTGAGVTQDGAIIQAADAGAVSINAGTNVITLNNSGNDFTGSVSFNNSGANNILLTNSAALILGASNFGSGTLGITAGGTISQTGTLVQASGGGTITLAVTAPSSDILLASDPNNFSGSVIYGGTLSNIRDVARRNVNANATVTANIGALPNLRNLTLIFDNAPIALPAVTLNNGGNLYLDAGGSISQSSGPLVVPGTTTLIAGANSITLTQSGNIFGGDIFISNSGANNIALSAISALSINTSTVGSGTLSLTGAGITQDGAITQASGAGTATFNAGAGVITLANSGNDFTGSVSLNNSGANDVQLTTSGALVLATSSVGSGALDLTTGGGISETGPFTQAANAGIVSFSLTSPNSDVNLSTQPNVFTGYFDVVGTTSNLRDFGIWNTSASEGSTVIDLLSLTSLRNLTIIYDNVGEVTLPTLTLHNGGNLYLDTSGDIYGTGGEISQSGVLTIPGTAYFNAGSNPISLTQNNVFSGAVTLINSGANDVALTNSGLLTLASVTVGSGNLTLTGLGINQSGAITQAPGAASATFNGGAGAITLTNSGNSFTAPVSLNNSGDFDINLSNSGALAIAASSIGSGALNLTADGNFSETGAIVQAATAGAVTLTENAATSNIILNQANDINGGVTFATGATLGNVQDFSLNNVDSDATLPSNLTSLSNLRNLSIEFDNASISLPALTLNNGGSLSAIAGGAISQTGVLTVPGTASFNAGTTITLTQNNSFTGSVSLTNSGDNNVAVVDSLNLNLDASSVGSGTLNLTGAGITQDGAIIQAANAGMVTLTAGSNPINLSNSGNDFTGSVSLNNSGANDVQLSNSGPLVMATSNVGSGALGFTVGGSLTEVGPITQEANAGLVTFNFTVPNSDLLFDTQPNGFTGYFSGAGNLANIRDVGIWNISSGGTAVIDLSSLVNLRNVTIIYDNVADLIMPSFTVGGNLYVNTSADSYGPGGEITQSGAVTVAGNAYFNAGANALLLPLDNSIGGTVTLINSGDNNVALTNTAALTLAASTVGSGTLSLTGDGITQTGTITQAAGAGAVTLNGGAGAITLTNSGNDFTGSVSLDNSGANNVALTNSGALALGASTLGSGTLTLVSGGDLTQTGAVTQAAGAGAVNLNAGTYDINLSASGNDFTGDVTLSSNNASLSNAASLTLAPSTIGGNLTIALSGSNASLQQTGALTVTGTSSFTAGTGSASIDLSTNGTNNSFGGAVTLADSGNGGVQLTNNGALTIAGVTMAAGNLSVTSDGTQTIAGAITNGDSGQISLTATGATSDLLINATVSSVSGNIIATAGRNLTLNGGNMTTSGNVSLTATAGAVTEDTSASTNMINGNLLTTIASTGTILNNANTITSFNATNNTSGDIDLSNTSDPGTLTITGITQSASDGNVNISNTGALTNSGAISLNGGNINMSTLSTDSDERLMTINNTISTNGGNITLSAANPSGSDAALTVNATLNTTPGTGGTLTAGGGVELNASPIVGAGNIMLSAGSGVDIIIGTINVVANTDFSAPRYVIVEGALTSNVGINLALIGDDNLSGTGGVLVTPIGSIDGGGNLTLTGSSLNGLNGLYGTSGVDPNAGVQIQAGATVKAAGTVTVNEGTGNSNIDISGPLSSTGANAVNITPAGTGMINLAAAVQSAGGAISFNAPVNVTSSTTVDSGNGANSAVTFASTVSGTGTSLTLQNNTAANGTVTFDDDVSLASLTTFAQPYAVVMNGANNTFTSAVTFNNTNGVTLGNSGTTTSNFNGGLTSTAGTTTLNGTINTANAAVLLGAVTLATDTTLNTGTGSVTFGTISGNDALTSSSTTNTVTLNGQVGSLSTPLTNLSLNGAVIVGSGAGAVYTSGDQTYGGTVTLQGDTSFFGNNLNFNGATTSIDGVSGQNLTINTTGASTVANAISANIQNVTLNSANGYTGSLLLASADNYTGTTAIDAGTLIVGDNAALSTGSLDFNGGALAANSAGITLSNPYSVLANGGSITGGNAISLSSSGTLTGTLTNANTASTTLSTLVGTGGLTQDGSGTLILTADSSAGFSGTTTLSNGTLEVDNNGGLGTGLLLLNNGTLDTMVAGTTISNSYTVGGSGVTIGGSNAITLSGSGILDAPLTNTNTAMTTLSGILSGSADLTQNGSGTLTLPTDNSTSYSGTVTLMNGTLEVDDNGGFGSGALVLNGGTLDTANTNGVTLDNSFTVGGLGSTIGGSNAITMSGDGTLNALLTNSNSAETTLSGTLSGSAGLTQSGLGTLTLPTDNSTTYSGTVTLSSGTLEVDNNGGLGTGTLVLNGGTLDTLVGGTVISNSYTVGGSGATIGGGNAITLSGTGAVNALLTNSNSATTTLSGTLSGSAGLTQNGSGTLAIEADNSAAYSGTVTLTSGTLEVDNNGALGISPLILNGGILDTAVSGTTIPNAFNVGGLGTTIGGSNAITLSGSGTLSAALSNSNTATTTLSGTLSGAAAINQNGSGTLVLSGNSAAAYTGTVTLSSGILEVDNDSALGTGQLALNGGTLVTGSSGTSINNSYTVGGSGATIDGGNAITLAGSGMLNALLTNNNSATTTLSGTLSGTAGLTQNGSGILILSVDNTAGFSGTTTLSNGTLEVDNNGALGTGQLVLNGGTLDTQVSGTAINNGYTVSSGSSIGGSNAITLSGSGIINATLTNSNTATTTLSGSLSGTAGLTQASSGTLILPTDNTAGFSGTTTLESGTLEVDNNGALGTGTLALNGGTLDTMISGTTINNNFTVGGSGASIGGSNAITLSGDGTLNALLTNSNSATTTLSGNLSGSAGLTQSGLGTLVLPSDNTAGFSGTTTITSGTLEVDNNGALGTGLLALNGGTLDTQVGGTNINNDFTVGGSGASIGGSNAITLSGDSTLNAPLTNSNSANTTLSGTLSGTADLTQVSSGTLILTTDNTAGFSGTTQLLSGILEVDNNGALGTGTLAFDGGTLDTQVSGTGINNNFTVDGSGSTIGGSNAITLSGNGTLDTTLTVSNTAQTTLAGNLSGAGNLTENAANGTLILSGENNYTGATTVTQGILDIASNQALGSASTYTSGVTVASGAELDINAVMLAAPTPLSLSGTGVSGNGALVGIGTSSWSNGSITLTNATTIGTENNSDVFAINGSIDGAFDLTLAGPGTINLNNVVGGNIALTSVSANNTLTNLGINTAAITTSGDQTYNSDVTLNGSSTTTLTTTANSGNGDVLFSGTVDGPQALSIASGSGSVTFDDAVGANTALAALSLSGTTNINGGSITTSGAQTYNGAVVLGSDTTLSSMSGGITLNSVDSAASTSDSLTVNSGNGAIDLNDVIGGNVALNNFTATSTGGSNNITVADNINATGNISITAGGSVNLSGGNLETTGNVSLTGSAGTVSEAAGSVISGALLTVSSDGGTTLNNANTVSSFNASNSGSGDINFTNSGALDITGVNQTVGNLTINNSGDITQSGAVIVNGSNATATFGAGASNDITLTNAGNRFTNLAISSANNASITASSGINLEASSINGNLTINATGAVTQSGALTVPGTSSFSAGANALTLTNVGNIFTGGVTLTNSGDNDVNLSNNGLLTLDNVSVGSGALTFNSTGITQDPSTAITQASGAGTFTVNAGAGSINLANAGNTLFGAVSLENSGTFSVALSNSSALTLGTSNVGSGTLSITAGGSITENGAITQATGADTVTLASTAASSDILLNTASNDFSGAITIGGDPTLIRDFALENIDSNASLPTNLSSLSNLRNLSIDFANSAVSVPTVTLTNGGNLAVIAGGSITQTGDITVPGTTNLNAGANVIDLSDNNNSFSGGVTLANSGDNDVTVGNNGLLTLDNVSVGSGALTFNSTGITQDSSTAITQASGAGPFTVNAGAGEINLANAGNTLFGAVSLNNSGTFSVALSNSGALTLGTSNVGSGTLSITAGGSITEMGAITQASGADTVTLASTAASSDILLNTAANDFSGAITIGGDPTLIRDFALENIDSNASLPTNLSSLSNLRNLTVDFANAGVSFPTVALTNGGNLSVIAGGSITQTGAITVPGTTTLNAASYDITLTQANDFVGTVSVTAANDATLVNNTALTIGATTTADSLTLNASGIISQVGAINTPTLATTSSGGLNLNGANTVSNFSATNNSSGDILFDNTAEPLTITGITQNGGNVTVSNTGTLTTSGDITTSGGAVNLTTLSPDSNARDLNVNGGITTNGGAISLSAANPAGTATALNVTGLLNTGTGSGGILTVEGGTSFVTPIVGSGSITLNGNGLDLVVGNFTAPATTVFTTNRFLVINGIVTSSAGESLSFIGDQTLNGSGGVLITPTGSITDGGDLTIQGSNLNGLSGQYGTSNVDPNAGVQVQAGATVQAAGNISLSEGAGSSNIDIGAALLTTGANSITVAPASGGSILLSANLTSTGGAVNLNGPVTLGNSVAVSGGNINFNGNLTGGANTLTLNGNASGSDTYTLTNNISFTTPGSSNITINGMSGASNTLQVLTGDHTLAWNIATLNTGTLLGTAFGLNFNGVQNLTGNSNNDNFVFGLTGQLSGSVAGSNGSYTTIDFTALTQAVTAAFTRSNAGSVSAGVTTITGFNNINNILVNGAYNNTMVLPNQNNSLVITGTQMGSMDSVYFTGFTTFQSTSGSDRVNFTIPVSYPTTTASQAVAGGVTLFFNNFNPTFFTPSPAPSITAANTASINQVMAQMLFMQPGYNMDDDTSEYTAIGSSDTSDEIEDAMIRQINGLPFELSNNLYITNPILPADEEVNVTPTASTGTTNDNDEERKKKIKHKATSLQEYRLMSPEDALKKALHYQPLPASQEPISSLRQASLD